MPHRARQLAVTALLTAFVLPSVACGTIELPIDLALEQPSEIAIDLSALFPPPNDLAVTSLVGGVETTITAQLGLIEFIAVTLGQALPATIAVDDIRIAGTELLIGGLLSTGTLCVAPDPLVASGGVAMLNLLLGVAAFDLTLASLIYVTDPFLGPTVGGALPFAAEIDAITPLSIGDLLALATGTGGGLVLTQEIDTMLPPDTPIIGAAGVSATLSLATTDVFPTDPLLDECEIFLSGL